MYKYVSLHTKEYNEYDSELMTQTLEKLAKENSNNKNNEIERLFCTLCNKYFNTEKVHINTERHQSNQKKFRIRYYGDLKTKKKIIKGKKGFYGISCGRKKLKLFQYLYNYE